MAMTDSSANSTHVPRAPLPWRVAAWLAMGVAIALLSLVAVHWGWRWLGPASTVAPVPAIPERWAPVIVATPLFGRAAAPVAADAATGKPATTTLQGDTRLLGVFAERNGGGYALFRLPDRGPVLVASGQKITADVTLEAVHPEGVRIRDRGVEREIRLRAAVQPAAPPVAPTTRVSTASDAVRAACTGPAGFKGRAYRLNAELLTGIASQPESWTALLSPVSGGLAVRDQSGFASMLGMKAGDRMAQANGIALGGVDDVLVAFVKPLIANQSVHVTGVRDGRPAEWLFLNAGACP
jgi:hypothetical protein